jgi:hypothetical protein
MMSEFKTANLRASRFSNLPLRYKEGGTVCTEHQRHILDVSMMALTLNVAGVRMSESTFAELKRSFNDARINMHPYGAKTSNVGGSTPEGYTKATNDGSVMRSIENSFRLGTKVELSPHGVAHVEKQVDVLLRVVEGLPLASRQRIFAAYRKVTAGVVHSDGYKVVDGRRLPASTTATEAVNRRTAHRKQRETLYSRKSKGSSADKHTTTKAAADAKDTSTAPKYPIVRKGAAAARPSTETPQYPIVRKPSPRSSPRSVGGGGYAFMHSSGPSRASAAYSPPMAGGCVGFTSTGNEVFSGSRGGYYHVTSSGGAAYHPGGRGVAFV